MPDPQQLLSQLDAATHKLTAALMAVPAEAFNTAPSGGGWSPAAVAEHILLLETLVNRNFEKAHDVQRPHDAKVDPVKQALENAESKFVAPDFLHPSTSPKEKESLVHQLQAQRDRLRHYILTLDLCATVDLKHPSIGSMTRWEWVSFIIHHAARHIRQIEA